MKVTQIVRKYRKILRYFFIFLLIAAFILYFKSLFVFVLLIVAFIYKFITVRMGVDYLGLDPFWFCSFYVGYAYGFKMGLIFGFLFGFAFNLAQKSINIRCLWLVGIFVLVGMMSSMVTFLEPVTAGFAMVYLGALLDLILILLIFGPLPRAFIVHAGHALFAYFLIVKILKYMPGV